MSEFRNAQAWHRTAGLAAREAQDKQLTALVLTRSAFTGLYDGAPNRALAKLAKARTLLGRDATPIRVRALACEARILAALDLQQEARHCLVEAEDTFEAMPSSALADPMSGCTGHQFFFYTANTYTRLGMVREAASVQQQLLGMYRTAEYLDPALIKLDQARCMAQGDAASACEYAIQAIAAVPTAHRALVLLYGERFLSELPETSRDLPAARELRDLVSTTSN